jgi:UDPglucose 6-dehydrogenase
MSMRIAVIGTGYVGLVTSGVFSHLGHQVIGLDIDQAKIAKLRQGKITIYEPGLESLIKQGLKTKRLQFTTNYPEAIKGAELVFICVGTPAKKDGSYDAKYVYAAAQSLAENLDHYLVVVIKSTVPPSTTDEVARLIKAKTKVKFSVASCPEFLREGSAVPDALHPARIVIGTESKKAQKLLLKVHQKIKAPLVLTTPQSAQLIKYASNAFLATKISFINTIAILCDRLKADIKAVAKGLGLDPRIGQSFLEAGLGYGGSCFPKDTWALIAFAQSLGYDFKFLKQVDIVNQEQINYFISKIKQTFSGSLKGKTLTILGLAFKPHTDDLREARSVVLIKTLQRLGAKINAYDPVAIANAKKELSRVNYFSDPYQALKNSYGLLLVTEWPEFKKLNFKQIKKIMAEPNVFDGRNLFDPRRLQSLGFKYLGIGHQ